MTSLDEHQARFAAHYARIKDAQQPDEWKVARAEQFASNPLMSFLIEDTLSAVPPFPFEPADYTTDGLKPEGKRR